MQKKQPTVLVTGANGLVGSHLVKLLLEKGFAVRILLRSDSHDVLDKCLGQNAEQHENVEIFHGHINSLDEIETAMEGIDEVYHCAAMVSFRSRDIEEMNYVNIEGTANMVNVALANHIKKFCYVSSVAALGRTTNNEMINEEHAWKKSKYNSAYAVSKFAAENEVWRGIEEGLNAVIVNPVIVVGAGNWKSSSATLFQQVWKGLKFYTKGSSGFVDVKDVAQIVFTLMEKNIFGERFVLSAENISYKKFFEQIAEHLHKPKPSIEAKRWMTEFAWRFIYCFSLVSGSKPSITKATSRNSHQQWNYDSGKIKSVLGYEFKPIEKSIAETAAEFLRQKKINQ